MSHIIWTIFLVMAHTPNIPVEAWHSAVVEQIRVAPLRKCVCRHRNEIRFRMDDNEFLVRYKSGNAKRADVLLRRNSKVMVRFADERTLIELDNGTILRTRLEHEQNKHTYRQSP